MYKFKHGDKVKVISKIFSVGAAHIGATGTISEPLFVPSHDIRAYHVKFDGKIQWWDERSLALVEE